MVLAELCSRVICVRSAPVVSGDSTLLCTVVDSVAFVTLIDLISSSDASRVVSLVMSAGRIVVV